jgi:hypothetical protein
MSVETIEPARAEEFEQAQRGGERGIMGDHHRLPHQIQAILSRHSDTTSINRRDPAGIDDGSPVLEALQHPTRDSLGAQLVLVYVGEAEVETPFPSHGAHIESAALAFG